MGNMSIIYSMFCFKSALLQDVTVMQLGGAGACALFLSVLPSDDKNRVESGDLRIVLLFSVRAFADL